MSTDENESWPKAHTLYKNEVKMDYRCEHKTMQVLETKIGKNLWCLELGQPGQEFLT